jgi:hypothetical protein
VVDSDVVDDEPEPLEPEPFELDDSEVLLVLVEVDEVLDELDDERLSFL